jgi:hypothetical protein
MNHDDRQELLDELYPPGGGPPVESVLARLREDRAARKRRRRAATAVAVMVAVAALAVFWRGPKEVAPRASLAVAAQPKAESFERISDEQLLAAVGGPAALVTLPDGRQRVMMLVPARQR